MRQLQGNIEVNSKKPTRCVSGIFQDMTLISSVYYSVSKILVGLEPWKRFIIEINLSAMCIILNLDHQSRSLFGSFKYIVFTFSESIKQLIRPNSSSSFKNPLVSISESGDN
jgi:hypothetical protein